CLVGNVVAADQVRAGAADAVTGGGALHRIDHLELLRQAEVVVAAEVQQPAAVDLHAHAVATADHAAAAHHVARQRFGALGLRAATEVGALGGHGALLGRAGPRRRADDVGVHGTGLV